MKQLLENESYCLGMSLTIEALKCCPDQINSIYLSSKAANNKELENLIYLANKHSIELIYDDLVIEKYSLKENCYCIGFFNKYNTKLTCDNHVICYEFTDYGQLGTIFRSAVSFDFKNIALINTNIDYFDPRVIRASMGSVYHLNICSYKSLDDYQKYFKHNIYCFNTTNVRELNSLVLKNPYSLIFSENPSALNKLYKEGFYLKHRGNELSLSALSSIVFNYCYESRVKL